MQILTIDTALQGCAVGLYDSEQQKIIAKKTLQMERGQAEQLVPMIEGIIDNYETLDLIAVTQGPGAFVGLRIGLMCAKTLSMVLDIPVVGVPTFDAMRASAKASAPKAIVLETKRSDYYAQITDQNPTCLNAEQIAEQCIKGTIIGNANDRLKTEIGQTDDLNFEDIEMIPPQCLALCALERYSQAPQSINSDPIYMRGPEIGTPKRAPRKIKN